MNFIVGGTHGLGYEIAQAYQDAGEETFVTGRSYDEAEHGPGLAIDLASAADAAKLSQYIEQKIGSETLKRFFWLAGYGHVGDFADQPMPQQMAEVNFARPLPAVQSAWRKMLGSNQPTNFVVVSSTSGEKPRKDEAVYVGTKHAQVGFTKSLELESERLGSNVRVALFNPSGMQTPFWEGTPQASYMEFLDPAKVAAHMVKQISEQNDHFYEETIPRGSL